MLSILSALIAGLIFGLGLILSGMGNPAKVQNFLDFFGTWDPSLALVMVGAIAVGLIAFTWAKRRKTALFGEPMQLPTARTIDTRLLLGSAMFGIGWGLAGFCPGPALMNLFTMHKEVVIFVVSMVVGMLLQQTWARK
ncbi:YeeE/YedE family protein [Diaphorobacter caeni]|uniref:YeeE/YedE family protein n=1 Tax=Diaphorobacter caeni TaxID=2784387 RepID=UPI00188E8734|nr:YeeE/YedE family protein [Diaphorobacter caeni]MBF5005697.1 YeeE/YedE family protein [Diaphorobacter caeni]